MAGRSLVLYIVQGPQVSLCGQQNGVTNATNFENKEAYRFATSIRADPDPESPHQPPYKCPLSSSGYSPSLVLHLQAGMVVIFLYSQVFMWADIAALLKLLLLHLDIRVEAIKMFELNFSCPLHRPRVWSCGCLCPLLAGAMTGDWGQDGWCVSPGLGGLRNHLNCVIIP